jgi:hypothetical protein
LNRRNQKQKNNHYQSMSISSISSIPSPFNYPPTIPGAPAAQKAGSTTSGALLPTNSVPANSPVDSDGDHDGDHGDNKLDKTA